MRGAPGVWEQVLAALDRHGRLAMVTLAATRGSRSTFVWNAMHSATNMSTIVRLGRSRAAPAYGAKSCGKPRCFADLPGPDGLGVHLALRGCDTNGRGPGPEAATGDKEPTMRQIALGIVITGLISTSAWAEEPAQVRLNTSGAFTGVTFSTLAASEQTAPAPAPAPEPPAKKVTGTVGADIPTAYYFRGYRQEFDPQFTIQPFIDVAIAGDKASFNVGLFNSFHTGTNKDAGYGYYETDFYAAATVHNIKATYTAYTYPKIDDSTSIKPQKHVTPRSTRVDVRSSPRPCSQSAAKPVAIPIAV